MKPFSPILAILALVLAGCAETPAGSQATTSAPDEPSAPELSTLVVVVLTGELQPVAGAVVEISGTEHRASTDESGSVRFTELEPLSYTIVAAKPGYKPLHPRGRVVELTAGETSEVKMTLDPIGVVAAEDSYHMTLIFRGFISCSIEHFSPSGIRNRSQCGNGVDVAGNRVGRDPNDNFSHPWQVDNPHIETIIQEAKWAPSFSALGDQLYTTIMDAFTCNANSCNYSNEVAGKGGKSPLRVEVHEGQNKRITALLERSGSKEYPQPAWAVMRTHCGTGCVAALTLQQSYEVYTSPFYGMAAPEGFTALQ